MFEGKLEIDPECKIGYVSQFPQVDKTKETTVFEYIGEEFIKIQDEITALYAEMSTTSDMDSLMEKVQLALDAFESMDGDNFENTINKQLNLANLMKLKDLNISDEWWGI